MSQRVTGGALVFIGAASFGFEALGIIVGYATGIDPFSHAYGILLVLLGTGVYADEIRFQDSAEKFEGLIFFYAIIVIIMMIGSVFISLS